MTTAWALKQLLSEPVYDYSDDVYDYSDRKKDFLIQTLSVFCKKTLWVYETFGASEESPIVAVWKDGTVKNNLASFKFCTKFEIDRICRVVKFFHWRWLSSSQLRRKICKASKRPRSSVIFVSLWSIYDTPLCDGSDPKFVCKILCMNAQNVTDMIVRWDDGYEFVFTRVQLSFLMEAVGFSKTVIINMWVRPECSSDHEMLTSLGIFRIFIFYGFSNNTYSLFLGWKFQTAPPRDKEFSSSFWSDVYAVRQISLKQKWQERFWTLLNWQRGQPNFSICSRFCIERMTPNLYCNQHYDV